jgi:hypothetical protein
MKNKCQIIPVNEYDGLPSIVFEDDKHRYTIGLTGHLTRLRKKTCSLCRSSISHVVVFEYAKHRRVERFCRENAANYGEVPPDPIVEQQELNLKLKLTNKQKLAIQKWTNIKVRM